MQNTRDKRHPRERYGEVLYKNEARPHPQSPAALALLVLDLWRHDETIYRGDRWMEFKEKFLQDFAAIHGKVFCHWCGRDNMKLKGEPSVKDKDVVTLDHLTPTSKGGALYDPNNVVPACFSCNNRRASDEDGSKHAIRESKRQARSARWAANFKP